MIDTDKYEGHTEGMWIVESGSVYLQDEVTPIARMDRDTNHTTPTERDSNARLIADAPLLLEDYKRLLKNINEYVDKVEAFHKMLKEEYEMKHKIPLCPEYKNNFPGKERKVWKEHNWVMDDWVGHRCVDCGFHLGKPLSPPKWKGDDE